MEHTQEPPKPQSRRRHEATNTTKGGDERKRDDYHAALYGYLEVEFGLPKDTYPDFVSHVLGGDLQTCDIHRLADLARRAYVARHRGDAAAKEHIAGIVDEFMTSLVRDDEPPQDTAEQQALV